MNRNDGTMATKTKQPQPDVKTKQSDVKTKQSDVKTKHSDVKSKQSNVKMKMPDTTFKQYDVLYKVLVIGESSVGKSALINKYQNPDQPLPNLLSTIGIDFRLVDMVIDGLRVRVQLWDTVGQER